MNNRKNPVIKRRLIMGIIMIVVLAIFLIQALDVTTIYSSINSSAAGQGFLGILTSGYGIGLGIYYIVTRAKQPTKLVENVLDIIVIVLSFLCFMSASKAYSDLSLLGSVLLILNLIAMPWGKGYKEYSWETANTPFKQPVQENSNSTTQEKSSSPSVTSSTSSTSDKLEELQKLYKNNLISESEYNERKNKLLDQLTD
ncbi:SHOCT domain-containing protein [Lactobacillus sp. PV037]|uniref:SHOCT domain-containing protein n=1 Tax=Lactobacillus sp. PV037 TaxID=2594496 RepID=UPI002240D04E|nr:SHOCT domain-containing protein [Lactobacillus sp. PV037]QNQ83815.1 SHOCT domain-containing protein [Lactobacillus sp. PV037]